MFIECTRVRKGIVTDTLTCILPTAFRGYTELKEVIVPNTPTRIGSIRYSLLWNLPTLGNVTFATSGGHAWYGEAVPYLSLWVTTTWAPVARNSASSNRADGTVLNTADSHGASSPAETPNMNAPSASTHHVHPSLRVASVRGFFSVHPIIILQLFYFIITANLSLIVDDHNIDSTGGFAFFIVFITFSPVFTTSISLILSLILDNIDSVGGTTPTTSA